MMSRDAVRVGAVFITNKSSLEAQVVSLFKLTLTFDHNLAKIKHNFSHFLS